MLRLIAVDLSRPESGEIGRIRAQILMDAADYLAFLEEDLPEELSDLNEAFTSKIAEMEKALESLRS